MIHSSENVCTKSHEIPSSGLDMMSFQKTDRQMSFQFYIYFIFLKMIPLANSLLCSPSTTGSQLNHSILDSYWMNQNLSGFSWKFSYFSLSQISFHDFTILTSSISFHLLLCWLGRPGQLAPWFVIESEWRGFILSILDLAVCWNDY